MSLFSVRNGTFSNLAEEIFNQIQTSSYSVEEVFETKLTNWVKLRIQDGVRQGESIANPSMPGSCLILKLVIGL